MAKVGIAYDLIRLEEVQGLPLDCMAELDSEETIQAVAQALEVGGHEVILLEADEQFPERLNSTRPDIVFNIAEGIYGECREALVPAMCEFFGIPYTGSGVLTLSLSLNKARANDILNCQGVLVPPYQVFYSSHDKLKLSCGFPLIVKLLHEGSSMGLSRKSVVKDDVELRDQVQYLIDTYHQPALVQKFIQGREFTVGVLGNDHQNTLPITEIVFNDPYGIVTFCPDEEMFSMVEQARGEQFLKEFKSQVVPKKVICPAQVSSELAERINQTVVHAFIALECRDWGRVDMRMDEKGKLYVLELNPIAGIAPGYWLPNSAAVAGLDYPAFINRILDIAWERVQAGCAAC